MNINKGSIKVTGSNVLGHGIKNVTTAGTAGPLATDQACTEVTIIAKKTNTGSIYVGGATVSSTSYGANLTANESITLRVANLNQVYLDSSVNGEGGSYVYV